MATRMQQRRGTATQWTTANPILAAGEIGFESGTNKFKIGDGVNTWSALTYYASAAEIAALVDGAPDLLNTLNELAAAIGDDANFGTAIEASINTSVDEANTFTTTAVSTHRQLTQAVHGIADTSLLATLTNVATAKSEALVAAATDAETRASGAQAAAIASAASTADTKIGTHNSDTTNVHGIADTSVLATATTVATAKSEALTAAATDATNKVATAKSEAIAEAATAPESYSDASITTHNNDTTGVHGIVDTAALALTATVATDIATAVSDHNTDTTSVHGIADTSLLSTKAYADAAVSTHNDDTTNVHGIADTSLLALKSEVAAVTKTSLGLGNVTNTADADKPVSTAQSTAIATAKAEAIADATAQVNALVTGAPAAMNTLDELAAALGDDANFAASVTTSLGLKVDSLTPISQKSASYTLSALTERDDLIEMGSASAMTVTIPADATVNFPIGTSIDILQTSTGQVTIAGAGGVTVNATPGLKLRTTWSSCTLFKRAANTWVVYGDLTA